MALQWHSSRTEHGATLAFQGALTRESLQPLWHSRESLVEHGSLIDIDLRELSQLDSAGFALLCDIVHFYAQKGQVRLHHAPAILRDLALLYDLDTWLDAFIVE
ncbi:STAS domain-containing protein [Pasteurellaceae bacterium 20609_3]|uniref:STAS domain-containing protein n=1 Tax=Spirabiliibacterium mucosae TaxID=28156 RepID=UPI001AAE16DD|nr:STAS domain-containing protein [Spirabiliibacterium mucosae]MBE2898055.1 STAS domain-containing protein [Spirabiliibacterium mucosae]